MEKVNPGIYRRTMPFESNYVIAPNSWMRDSSLSLKAKGLLVYFLSHNDGYVITFKQILRENQDGKAAIRSAVDELVDKGYLRTERTTDERGYNGGLAYYMTNPEDSYPKSENPTLENPSLENQTAIKKNNSIREENLIKEIINVQNVSETGWTDFWKLYPRKQGKGSGYRAYLKALDIIDKAELLEAVARFNADPNRPTNAKYLPMPATWLNEERWGDDPYPGDNKVLSAEDLKRMEEEAERGYF
jgi:hypothetical protein